MAVPRAPRPLHVAPALRAARARPPFYSLGRRLPPTLVRGGGAGGRGAEVCPSPCPLWTSSGAVAGAWIAAWPECPARRCWPGCGRPEPCPSPRWPRSAGRTAGAGRGDSALWPRPKATGRAASFCPSWRGWRGRPGRGPSISSTRSATPPPGHRSDCPCCRPEPEWTLPGQEEEEGGPKNGDEGPEDDEGEAKNGDEGPEDDEGEAKNEEGNPEDEEGETKNGDEGPEDDEGGGDEGPEDEEGGGDEGPGDEDEADEGPGDDEDGGDEGPEDEDGGDEGPEDEEEPKNGDEGPEDDEDGGDEGPGDEDEGDEGPEDDEGGDEGPEDEEGGDEGPGDDDDDDGGGGGGDED
ncbi:uncharacterized protein LOC143696651 [Agelaius phoeniceus]|uniref:uncharacterized protein LOC143696651 n=1 Tax=Agelaius phoeniceus TaxID=39638 RepID=UPI00405501E5